MDLLLHALTSSALFASRAFLPAFVTAFVLRHGDVIPFLGSTDFVESLPDVPSWFTSNLCIGILGLLSLVELAANHSADARSLLQEIDRYAKPAMAVLTVLGLASTADVEFAQETMDKAGLEGLLVLGLGATDGGLAAVVGAIVFWLAGVRGDVMELLSDADEDDDAGVQGAFAWAEDALAVGGTLFLILYPLLMALALATFWGLLFWLRRRAEAREEAARVPCAACGAPCYASAVACPKCHATRTEPRRLNWLGVASDRPAGDLAAHPLQLAARKRCPRCAARLKDRTVRQTCPECALQPFADPAFLQRYLHAVRARLPGTLVVCALLSLVPVVGLVPGVIWFRLQLVGPFRRYVPRVRSVLTKWMLRLLFLVLSLLQLVPGAGAAAVPLMALVNYGAWRRAFVAQVQEKAVGIPVGST